MNKINTIALLTLFSFLIPKAFSFDLAYTYANFPSTLYIGEKFDLYWGCTILTRVGETRSAITLKANFYISNDQVLDTTDLLIGTSTTNLAAEVGYFEKAVYNLNIAKDQFPLGKQYLIIHMDPDKVHTGPNETIYRAYPINLFTRQADLSFLATKVAKNKAVDSSLVLNTRFYNSGSTTLTNFDYKLSIANTIEGLSNPIYSYIGSEQNLTTETREKEVNHTADLQGLGVDDSSFVVKWEIVSSTPTDVDASNNVVIKIVSWAQLETIDLTTQVILMTNRNDTISTCNAIFFDDGGEYKGYSNNIRSTIRIKPSVEGKMIKIKLKGLFSLFGFDDALRFYNPDDLTEPTNIFYHINRSNGDYVMASNANDGSMIVSFITIITCKDTIYDDGGYGTYSNNSNGTLTIYPEEGQVVKLHFDEFNTEASYDRLKIYNGINTSGTPLITLSGLNPTIPEFIANNDYGALTINFSTDYGSNQSGFIMTTSCFTPSLLKIPESTTETIYSCDTIVYDNGGVGRYNNNSDGALVIYPKNTTDPVNISFDIFNTQETTDVLKVYSGNSTAGTLLATLSGTELPSLLTSTDLDNGALTLQFISNDTATAAGFKIKVGCAIPTITMIKNKTMNVKTCRSTIYDNGGIKNYTDNSNDVLIIEPDRPGAKVKLQFEQYTTETGYDFLSIFDGVSATGTPIDKLSGSKVPQTIYMASNSDGALTLNLRSDNVFNELGFVIKVTCDLGNVVGFENDIESETNNLAVYPQPNNGTFKISSSAIADIKSMSLYNSNGQLVYQTNLVNSENIMLPDTIGAGLYIIEIKQDSNITLRSKLIIE